MRTRNMYRHWPVLFMSVAFILALGYQSHALRNAVAPAQPTAVATANLESIFNRLDEREAADVQLQELAESMQRELDALARRIQALEEELELYRPGTENFQSTLQTLTLKAEEFQAEAEFSRRKIEVEKSIVLRRIYNSIRESVKREAESRGIDLVIVDDSVVEIPPGDEIETSRQISARRILYANPGIDITEDVVRRMNLAFREASRG